MSWVLHIVKDDFSRNILWLFIYIQVAETKCGGGGGWEGCYIAARSTVSSSLYMVLCPSARWLRRRFYLFFDHSTNLGNVDRLRFAIRVHSLRRVLRRANYISAPCGREQGAKWDHNRVGKGLDGIRRADKSPVLFSRLFYRENSHNVFRPHCGRLFSCFRLCLFPLIS